MAPAVSGGVFNRAAKALANTPKRGGHIRVAGLSSSAVDTLDPARRTRQMIYNGLTRLDASLAPRLAGTIENEKAAVWTFKLRKGVTFHDGKPLTSGDVVYSLLRHKDPAVGSVAKALAAHFPAQPSVNTRHAACRGPASSRAFFSRRMVRDDDLCASVLPPVWRLAKGVTI